MKHENFQTHEEPFSKNVQGKSKIYHEELLLMKFLHTKTQFKYMNKIYYDFYYTVIKTRDDNNDNNEKNENDFINFNDFITPHHYIGRKCDNEILW